MKSGSKRLVGLLALSLLSARGSAPEGSAGSRESGAQTQQDEQRAQASPGPGAPRVRIRRVEGGATELCGAEVCFDVSSDEGIGQISVDAQACLDAAAPPELTLFEVAGGERRQVSTSTVLESRGLGCEGGTRAARGFGSLSSSYYVVCATYPGFASVGAVTVYARAGGTCAEGATLVGGCRACYGEASGAGEPGAGAGGEGRPDC